MPRSACHALVLVPKERVVRIKGDKTQTTSGRLTIVTDNATGEITLLNPAGKQYARIPLTEFAAALQKAVPLSGAAQQTLQSLKFDIDNKKTGQTGMVAGFRAEERLMTMAISMPDVSVTSGLVSSGLYWGGPPDAAGTPHLVASPEIRAASR